MYFNVRHFEMQCLKKRCYLKTWRSYCSVTLIHCMTSIACFLVNYNRGFLNGIHFMLIITISYWLYSILNRKNTWSIQIVKTNLQSYTRFIALGWKVLLCYLLYIVQLTTCIVCIIQTTIRILKARGWKAWQHSVKYFRESEESPEHHKIGDIMLANLLQMKVNPLMFPTRLDQNALQRPGMFVIPLPDLLNLFQRCCSASNTVIKLI
jgi:hypothetical protein